MTKALELLGQNQLWSKFTSGFFPVTSDTNLYNFFSRNWGKKFVEANESYALLGFKIKAKMASSNGYSFMMIWNGILPEDVEFEGFTRFVVQKIFRDQA